MTADDRQAWVAVAKATLTGMPADLLVQGCRKARQTCRFVSEIVPTIMATVEAEWTRRKRAAEEDARRTTPRLPEPECVTADEVRKLIQSLSKSVD